MRRNFLLSAMGGLLLALNACSTAQDHGPAWRQELHGAAGHGPAAHAAPAEDKGAAATDADLEGVPVPPPPFSEGIFPCSECHSEMDTNPNRRELVDEHTNIKFHHGNRERWCFDCHNPDNRDKLRLASGKLIDFKVSYLLCGQCHGPKLRDWRAGVHGKRTGSWNGDKQYLLCVNCHDPHNPRFKPLEPKPRPKRPDEITAAAPSAP